MTQTQSNKPADTIRYGGLKGTIWKNAGKDGAADRYTVNYQKSYRDADGNWHDTSSLGEYDNLKLGVLVPLVATRINQLKAESRSEEQSGE